MNRGVRKAWWGLLALVAGAAQADDMAMGLSLLGGVGEYHYVQTQNGLHQLQGSRFLQSQRVKEKSDHSAVPMLGVAFAQPVAKSIAVVGDLQYFWDAHRNYASHSVFTDGSVYNSDLSDNFMAYDFRLGITLRPELGHGVTAFLTPGYSWLTQSGEQSDMACHLPYSQITCGTDIGPQHFHGAGFDAGVDVDLAPHVGLRLQYRREYLSQGLDTSSLALLGRVFF